MSHPDDGAARNPLARVADVVNAAPGIGIAALASIGGLDRATDFAHTDLRGWFLDGEDVRGFDFSGSDLRGTGIENAVRDETTILDDARLDRPLLRLPGLAPASVRRSRVAPEGYTKVRIPDLSDAELLEREFVIRDPLMLERLAYEPPPTDEWLTYEGRYEVGQYVTCAFGHRHKRGYAFRDEHNRRYLVGNSCGAKHLGMGSWKVFAKGREMLEDRASYLRAVRDLHDLFARNRDWLADLGEHPSVKAFDMARSVLAGRHPSLVSAVRGVSSSGAGRVALPVEERDFAAEESIREKEAKRAAAGRSSAPIARPVVTRRVLRDAGVLRGRSVFLVASPLRQELAHIGRFVDAFLAGRGLSTKRDLVETTRNAKSLVRRILAVAEAVEDFSAFFDQSNLELFARWADGNRFDQCRFSAGPGRVEIRNLANGGTDILAPPPAGSIEAVRLADLAAAWAGWSGKIGERRRRV